MTSNAYSTDNLRDGILPDFRIGNGSICADGRVINWVTGAIQCQYSGLVRSGVRIKVGGRTDLRVRWCQADERFFVMAQQVVATIPADAVRLECGIFRRSKQRWNRWIGRIVLVEQAELGNVYTVKIHGEEWTLKSHGPVVGARQPSRVWDVVNVVVDPQTVELSMVASGFITNQ